MRYLKYFILLLLLQACKNYQVQQAMRAEKDLDYEKAIHHYEKAIAKDHDYRAYKNLAILYQKRSDFNNAARIYDSLINHCEYPKTELLAYSEVLMATENYEDAAIWLDRYLAEEGADQKAITLQRTLRNEASFLIDSNQYDMEMLEIPATPQAYAAIPFEDGILYTGKASKDEKGLAINPWDGYPYSALYYVVPVDSGWSAPYDLSHTLNESYHIGPITAIPGSDRFILSKSRHADKKSARDAVEDREVVKRRDNKVQLFEVGISNMQLDSLVPLAFCEAANNYAQASISPDGQSMILSSDMENGKGGSDLYIVFLEEDGWSDPVNMGSTINTHKNESFPYFASEDTIYFSSEGHGSYGGLDVFYSTFDGVAWTKPVNMLFPMNSYQDDFAIHFNKDKRSGYVSSNRSGMDKLYSFTKNNPTFRIEGLVIEKENREVMPGVKITLINRYTKKDSIIYSDKDGKFTFPIAMNSKYKIKAEENDYFTLSYNISTRGRTQSKVFNVLFEMDKIVINKPIVIDEDPGLALTRNSRMKNIYYDFDKWDLRNDAIIELDRLAWLLKDNSQLKVEISAHTDSRGSDSYNLELSEKRAQAVVNYLIDRGISSELLVAKGYGETKLVNQCSNGVECTEEEHQENRRSEFKVIEIR